MKVLVAYGTKRGGTQGIAEMIDTDLRDLGVTVDLREAGHVKTLAGYDAAIIGGSVYAFRWHRHTLHLVKKHAAEFRGIPTWLFCAGPIGDEADHPENFEKFVPKSMKQAAADIGARGYVVFGGRLEPDARGFVAGKMAKSHSGDWRDPAAVKTWVQDIVNTLSTHH
jgi:menaquinone-dependent protoporphyrinogen oxidase